MERRLSTYVILSVLVWAIMGTITAGYYFIQYETYHSEYTNLVDQIALFNNAVGQLGEDVSDMSNVLEGISVRVNVFLSYGNGSESWFNGTVLPLGSTAFTAVYSLVSEINYTDYGGELGILVTSLNHVTNNSTHGWFYWYWDPGNAIWVLPNYSCARHILHRGDIVAFTYANYLIWPPPPPT